jgi:hypothetical protein
MAAQIAAVLLLLGPRQVPELPVLGYAALWVATIMALVSAVDYSRRFNALSGSRTPSPAPRSSVRPPANAEDVRPGSRISA